MPRVQAPWDLAVPKPVVDAPPGSGAGAAAADLPVSESLARASPELWADAGLVGEPPRGGVAGPFGRGAMLKNSGKTSGGWSAEVAPRPGQPTGQPPQLAVVCSHTEADPLRDGLIWRVLPAQQLTLLSTPSGSAHAAAALEALDREVYGAGANRDLYTGVGARQRHLAAGGAVTALPAIPGAPPAGAGRGGNGVSATNRDPSTRAAARSDGLLSRKEVLGFLKDDHTWLVPAQWPDPTLSQGLLAVLVVVEHKYRGGVLPKVQYIATARRMQRRGIGRSLLTHFVRGPAILEVHERNIKAQRLYGGLGFVDIGLAAPVWRLWYRPRPGQPATRPGLDRSFAACWPLPDSLVVSGHLRTALREQREVEAKGGKVPQLQLAALKRRVEKLCGLPSGSFDSELGHLSLAEVKGWFKLLRDEVFDDAPGGHFGPPAGVDPAAYAAAIAAGGLAATGAKRARAGGAAPGAAAPSAGRRRTDNG